MDYNLKILVDMGLQRDWEVFNLYGSGEGNAYEKINIEVITDGDSYVENTTASVAHAASSQYKELDAILPLVSLNNQWEITKYGSNFKKIMTGYYPITMSTEGGDLWSQPDSYLDYVNLFNVTFEETPQTYGNDNTQLYYDYKTNIQLYSGHSYIKKLFSLLTGSYGIKANIDLFHFSKYYNIYAPSTVPIPTLRPIIYEDTQLDNFNISIEGGRPHINNLLLMDIESDDGEEGFQMKNIPYNGAGYNWDAESKTIDMWRGVRGGMSMFKSCPLPDAEYPYKDLESDFYEFMPTGFSLLAIWDRSGRFNGDNKTHSSAYDGKSFSSPYFGSIKYDLNPITSNSNSRPLMTLVYFGDQQLNFRIFNNYFPVVKSGNNVTDTIAYSNSYSGKKPNTISMALVSVLANIYVYNGEDEKSNDVTYISDCIFLTLNTTMYTKDMIYKAEVIKGTDTLKMLLFLKAPFDLYVQAVKDAAERDQTIDHTCTAKDLNVTPDINACIKNIPIQININYLEPNIEAVGQVGNLTRVYKISGIPKSIRNWTPEPNLLYQIIEDDDGSCRANKIDQSFTIEYLKSGSLQFNDNKLKAEYDSNILPEVNSYIENLFIYDDNGIGFKYTKANGLTSNYYSFSTREYHGGSFGFESYYTYGTLKFIPKQDVLIPFAKFM